MNFVGNSPLCIKTGALEGYGYCYSLSTPCLRATLPSEPARSLLPSLGLDITRNAGRILMHDVAFPGLASEKTTLSGNLVNSPVPHQTFSPIITHSRRLQDLFQRRAGAEGRDPHDSGGNVRSARPQRCRQVYADAHSGHVARAG